MHFKHLVFAQMTAVERVFSLADLPPEEDPNVQSESAEVVENNYSSADLKGTLYVSYKFLNELVS